MLVFGSGVSRVSAQVGIASAAQNSELTTTAAASHGDRRSGIEQGAWSAATISLFNTWSAWDDNPGRHVSFRSPDHQKLVEVTEHTVKIRVGGRTFHTGINNETKHDAELGWSPDSSKFFVS
jgi:hypothetical protein